MGTRRRESEGERGWPGQNGGDGGRSKADRVEDETPSARRVCAVV